MSTFILAVLSWCIVCFGVAAVVGCYDKDIAAASVSDSCWCQKPEMTKRSSHGGSSPTDFLSRKKPVGND